MNTTMIARIRWHIIIVNSLVPAIHQCPDHRREHGRQQCYHADLAHLDAGGGRGGSGGHQREERHVVQSVTQLRDRLADDQQQELRTREHAAETTRSGLRYRDRLVRQAHA